LSADKPETGSISGVLRFRRRGFRVFLAAAMSCCTLEAQPGKPDFSKFVIVGDSLTAGFQNFSLFDDQRTADASLTPPVGGQNHGFTALLAQQAGVIKNLILPRIAYPGIPAALKLVGPVTPPPPAPTVEPEVCMELVVCIGKRENPSEQTNNLSVPGILLQDALAYVVPSSNPSNDTLPLAVLAPGLLPKELGGGTVSGLPCGSLPLPGGKLLLSEVGCAVHMRPTTVLVEIGNNDALQALLFGVSPTPAGQFALNFAILLGALKTTGATMVVANIPDVTTLPFLLSFGDFQAVCGVPPNDAGPDDFIVPDLSHPGNICFNHQVRPASLVSDTKKAVKLYNAAITAEANRLGATLVDVNALFKRISHKGYVVAGKHLTTAFLGGLFSLDGIHPSNTGYAILTNEFIDTLNSKLHTDIAPVSVEEITKTDPLFVFVPPLSQ
jgi:lysophospholipase L1-like esterase